MVQREGYLIFDIGTGNARVAVTDTAGNILSVKRSDIHYERDPEVPAALFFHPQPLWESILQLAQAALKEAGELKILGLTSTSQRQGIVLLDKEGNHLIGLPNIDNRGNGFEKELSSPEQIYQMTGRWPTPLFSGLKMMAFKEQCPDFWDRTAFITSISGWVTYQLSGHLVYEPSQATETLLYDVREDRWSPDLCDMFGLPVSMLPPVVPAGTVLGETLQEIAEVLNLDRGTKVIVGGADTQLAVKSVKPTVGDVVAVSGTTTPLTLVMDRYIHDQDARSWTNSHVEDQQWLLETNCGVTGLNYQMVKNIFYPQESYAVIEEEMSKMAEVECFAALGTSLISSREMKVPQYGGFYFKMPISHQLSRAHFAWATLWDIACAVKEAYETMVDITGRKPTYILGCGGGFQSETLRSLVAEMLGLELRIPKVSHQASIVGATIICNEALGRRDEVEESVERISPTGDPSVQRIYQRWQDLQKGICLGESL
ncbi:sugar kinase [Kroppenstedtia pulmonis]|uniref:Sugar kinase n=1 Tax=Kroppenstedtia pulmonis TaxID=1380685 RepID=A0A7D4CNT8_9BACL|nr:FGGY family carbohydrate kinase [Kroppenstedtia pulmonis]QKG85038.1 sugar kinase [Kroppenstedtia pulmonis]